MKDTRTNPEAQDDDLQGAPLGSSRASCFSKGPAMVYWVYSAAVSNTQQLNAWDRCDSEELEE